MNYEQRKANQMGQMVQKRMRRVLTLPALLTALVLAGCGSDSPMGPGALEQPTEQLTGTSAVGGSGYALASGARRASPVLKKGIGKADQF